MLVNDIAGIAIPSICHIGMLASWDGLLGGEAGFISCAYYAEMVVNVEMISVACLQEPWLQMGSKAPKLQDC